MKHPGHSFRGSVLKGKLTLDNPARFKALIPIFEGKRVSVTVGILKRKRTNPQNRYYWGIICKIAGDHFGYYDTEFHEAMKMMFLKKHEEGKPDTVRSTTTLSTVEFGEYIDRCQQFCAEHGIVIPDPESVNLDDPNWELEIDPRYYGKV